MVKRRAGLGRGLDFLLSTPLDASDEASAQRSGETVVAGTATGGAGEGATAAGPAGQRLAAATGPVPGLRDLPVEHIRRSAFQPRQQIAPEALQELADSIRAQGVIQPVIVRPVPSPSPSPGPAVPAAGGEASSVIRYELVAGERRWRAVQLAGLQTIPAIVRPMHDAAAAAVALIENLQREDLNPLEEAQAIARLIQDFSLTHEAAAAAVGRSRTGITNLLRLLDLHADVKTLLGDDQIGMGHARCLLALPTQQQAEAVRQVVEHQLSVRDTERLVQRLLVAAPAPRPRPAVLPEVRQLENRLAETLGAPVQVRYDRSGKGRLVIAYNSLDELDGILAHIR
jgi:ParB family chromosome partitioning protein